MNANSVYKPRLRIERNPEGAKFALVQPMGSRLIPFKQIIGRGRNTVWFAQYGPDLIRRLVHQFLRKHTRKTIPDFEVIAVGVEEHLMVQKKDATTAVVIRTFL